MRTDRYNKYIVLGGPRSGQLFPRTEAGLAEAMACGGVKIRPAVQVSEAEAEDWDDWSEYGCDIDRGNSLAYVKR